MLARTLIRGGRSNGLVGLNEIFLNFILTLNPSADRSPLATLAISNRNRYYTVFDQLFTPKSFRKALLELSCESNVYFCSEKNDHG